MPPRMPPTKTPGIRRIPIFQETSPTLAYTKNASRPVGGTSAIKLVPCARCCPKAKNSAKNGTNSTPPPIPNSPEAMPQRQAARKIAASRVQPSATVGLLVTRGRREILRLRFLPEQERGQDQKATEEPLKMARRDWNCNQPTDVPTREHPQCAQNSRAHVHLSLLPIFTQRTESHGRQENEKRSPLSRVLVHVQKICQSRHQRYATANAQQTDEYAHDEAQEQDDSCH